MYKSLKELLEQDAENKNLEFVLEELVDTDEQCDYLTLEEVNAAWKLFSNDTCKQYFCEVNEENRDNFLDWLRG